MEKLQLIMDSLVNIEYGLISLSTVLNALAENYEFSHKVELHENISVIKRQIDSLHHDFRNILTELDKYIDV